MSGLIKEMMGWLDEQEALRAAIADIAPIAQQVCDDGHECSCGDGDATEHFDGCLVVERQDKIDKAISLAGLEWVAGELKPLRNDGCDDDAT